jgi:hypothetical protein
MRDGKIQMLDPTWVPFNRELWSSLEQQQNFLVGTAEGMTLMETPISEPINHYLYIDNKAKLDAEGNLTGVFTIDAEGQSDMAVRSIMMGPKYRRANALEKYLRKYHANIVVKSFEGVDDPYTYSDPVHLLINYEIPAYAEVGDKEIFFNPPLTTGFFKSLFWHLSLNNSLDTRSQSFKTRCTQLIKETETIELPAYTKALYAPENPKAISGSSANYQAEYGLTDSIYTFSNEVTMNKRIFEKDEWSNVKSVVTAHKKTLDESIILEK